MLEFGQFGQTSRTNLIARMGIYRILNACFGNASGVVLLQSGIPSKVQTIPLVLPRLEISLLHENMFQKIKVSAINHSNQPKLLFSLVFSYFLFPKLNFESYVMSDLMPFVSAFTFPTFKIMGQIVLYMFIGDLEMSKAHFEVGQITIVAIIILYSQ